MPTGLEPQVQRRKPNGTEELQQRTPVSDWPSSDSDDDRPLAIALRAKRPDASDADKATPNESSPETATPLESERQPLPENRRPAHNERPQPFVRAKLYSAPSPDLEADARDNVAERMPDKADADMPPKDADMEEVETNRQSADSKYQMPPDSQELVTPGFSHAEAPVPTPEPPQEGDCMDIAAVSREEDLQEALMRLGLQTILSPSNKAIRTQDAELAAVPSSSPTLISTRTENDVATAAQDRLAEPEIASESPSLLPGQVHSTAEPMMPQLGLGAHETATESLREHLASDELTDLLLMNPQRSIPADVRQDAALNEASEASPIHAIQEEPGRHDDKATSLSDAQQPIEEGKQDPEESAAQDTLPQPDPSHLVSIAVIESNSHKDEVEASGANLTSVEPLVLPEQPISPAASVKTESKAKFGAIDSNTALEVVPDIIPDSEEEEALVV